MSGTTSKSLKESDVGDVAAVKFGFEDPAVSFFLSSFDPIGAVMTVEGLFLIFLAFLAGLPTVTVLVMALIAILRDTLWPCSLVPGGETRADRW